MIPQTNKKILIIAESINVEDSSGSKANVALIENLKEAGYELKVYHYSRKEIQLNAIECINIKEIKYGSNYFLSRLQRKIQHNSNLNLAKRLEPIFGFSFTFFNDTRSIGKALKMENVQDYNLILTLSKGASFRPHYAILKLPKFHSKWMAYIHDPYPFHLYPEPYNWDEPGYLKKIDFFKDLAAKCRWAAYPSLYLQQWMESYYSMFKNKGVIIPHQLKKTYELSMLPDYFDPSKFNLLHAGNLMKQRPPFALINGFLKFLKKNPEAEKDARLLLIGSSSYHKKELDILTSNILELYISNGVVNYSTVLTMQKSASVNIILESKAKLSPFLPGKFPHCIKSGNPIMILGPAKSEVRRLLGQDYKWWAEIDDVQQIESLISSLYSIWKNYSVQNKEYEHLSYYMSSAYLRDKLNKIIL
ncbi:UDP-glycosyltransferase [Salegentibacter sp. T436]|uniref:UDP-glycosyltransferase n=1 Tax=Salegentibacter sp. T436 TaxID=1729720 RepID=UPI00094A408E|nr:UDP-glycosyltransferase [Salegentibacter sp. T436]APS38806.1 hypothetical protein AO058_07915 [Salegentibacter sp. T436]